MLAKSLVPVCALIVPLFGGCTNVADVTWTGPGSIGTIQSAEWIRYTTTSDITFTGELSLNFFVLSELPDFCFAYQSAVADSFDAHNDFVAIRQPYEDADDLRNPTLCEATRDYYTRLGEATDGLTGPGTVYIDTTFGYTASGIVLEEGQPQEGVIDLTENALLEDGDFFRSFLRFYDDNPYTATAAALDCSDPNWGDADQRVGYLEYVAERDPSAGDSAGKLQSEMSADDLAHLAHRDVTFVDRDRSTAGVLNTDAEYLLCEVATHEFFLRVFER